MTEAFEPTNQEKFEEIKRHEVNAAFMKIIQNEFPEGIETSSPEQSTNTPEPSGTDRAIFRAHSEDMQQLLAQKLDSEERLKREKLISPLTGMPNLKAFENWLDAEIKTRPGDKLTVGFLDMDKLKTINDTYGHSTADDVIRRIGTILSSNMRQSTDDIAAHRSGDEFLVAFNGVDRNRIDEYVTTVFDKINRIHIRKINNEQAEIIEIDPQDTTIDRSGLHQVTISMGFATFEENMNTMQIMAKADDAMYKAKNLGRNRAYFSSKTPETKK
ncbi:diguanylate cyclase [Candidatus Saccharibacteria bacterium]|nr:diguanylate cyclase [Candidatus Saccharibacteria bacterium]